MKAGCPWCGADESELLAEAGVADLDLALEAHVAECDVAAAELGLE